MSTKATTRPSTSYDDDFYAWTQDQAEKLRVRRHNEIDWDNLAEEIESVGRSQKSEIRNRLRVLLQHLLKWHFQPELRCRPWQSTISEQRVHIEGVIEDSPSLSAFPEDALDWAYRGAIRKAAEETKLAQDIFPTVCPYTIEQVLAYDFMPGRPWHPDDLIGD